MAMPLGGLAPGVVLVHDADLEYDVADHGDVLALRPAPGTAAVQEARDVAQRERLALQALGEERRQRYRDAAERGLGPAGIQPLPRPAATKARKPKAEKPRTATPWVTPAAQTAKSRPAA